MWGYNQPFGGANMPLPTYPGPLQPRYNPVFDGIFAHNGTVNPFINNLLEGVNFTQHLIGQGAAAQQQINPGLQYANNVINPLVNNANQIYQSALGIPPGVQGSVAGSPGVNGGGDNGFSITGAVKDITGLGIIGGVAGGVAAGAKKGKLFGRSGVLVGGAIGGTIGLLKSIF